MASNLQDYTEGDLLSEVFLTLRRAGHRPWRDDADRLIFKLENFLAMATTSPQDPEALSLQINFEPSSYGRLPKETILQLCNSMQRALPLVKGYFNKEDFLVFSAEAFALEGMDVPTLTLGLHERLCQGVSFFHGALQELARHKKQDLNNE